MFCGDGINDLAALRAADIGFALGATDATIAASLSTRQRSVAGRLLRVSLNPQYDMSKLEQVKTL